MFARAILAWGVGRFIVLEGKNEAFVGVTLSSAPTSSVISDNVNSE